MRRIAGAFALAIACLFWTSSPPASADVTGIEGDIPVGGGIGLVVFEGGSINDLSLAASERGCSLRAVFALSRGRFVGHLVGAPEFVNRDFNARFGAGFPQASPLVIACSPPSFAPSLVAPASDSIGRSVQGRPIEVACYGDGERMLLLVGGMHTGPVETVSADLAAEVRAALGAGWLEVPTGTRACVISVLNVDGLALGTRTNAKQVDLNRNWPAASWARVAFHPEGGEVSGGTRPLSEPETQALYDYIVANRPAAVTGLALLRLDRRGQRRARR